jgi:hypothetical protein
VLVGCPTVAGVVRGGACATRAGDRTVSSPGSLWASLICAFFFMYILVFSQSTFVMGCRLLGHFRWLVS